MNMNNPNPNAISRSGPNTVPNTGINTVQTTIPNLANNDDWLLKYKPNKIKDLTTNTGAVKKICDWLLNYDKTKKEALQFISKMKNRNSKRKCRENVNLKSCMLITGNHGVGKTTTIDVVLKEMGYDVNKITISILKSDKRIEDTIGKILSQKNILTLINAVNNQKKAIIIDELESIVSNNEKQCIITLQKLNDIHWYCPIIFISNNQHNKLLSNINKLSFTVKMFPPYMSDMRHILYKISQNEKITYYPTSCQVTDKILEHAQGDLRRLIYTLHDIKYAYGTRQITPHVLDEYFKTSNLKDIDINLYKACEELLYNYTSISKCLKLFENDKVLLPLMVQQNYITSVVNSEIGVDKQFDLLYRMSGLLSIGDITENYIYSEQNWNMQDIHGFYTCVLTSFYMKHELGTEQENLVTYFAKDLNRTSIKNINKKNIINANKCLKNMNIYDHIYINKIIRKLIVENKIKECAMLLKDYDIKIEHLESLLKIDKIDESKIILTSKQKTEFGKYGIVSEVEDTRVRKVKIAGSGQVNKAKSKAKKVITDIDDDVDVNVNVTDTDE